MGSKLNKARIQKYFYLLILMLLMVGMLAGCSTTPEENVGTECRGAFREVESVEEKEEDVVVGEVIEREPEEEEEREYTGAEVYFIDVGQGDSSVIVTSEKEAIVIDAGEKRSGEEVLAVMEDAGVERVAMLVATHPHADHIGGVNAILDTYEVDEIVMSGHIATTKVFEGMLDKISEQGKSITQAEVGQEWDIGGVELKVMAVDTVPSDSNDSSVVMRAVYGETSILFTGDLEEKGERIVAEEQAGALESDILSVGHHGSSTSSSEVFLEQVNPSLAIVSVGEGNRYNHPSMEVMDRLVSRGATVMRTDEEGTIKIELDGKDIVFVEEATLGEMEPAATGRAVGVKIQGTPARGGRQGEVASVVVGEEVYIKDNLYHRKGCPSLEGEKVEKQLRVEAEKMYRGCSECM